MQFDLGIRCGTLLTMKGGRGDLIHDAFIGVNENAIAEVASFRESHVKSCAKFIDASDQIVMPGLINGHTHLPMSLFRGFEDDLPFHQWLYDRIFVIEAKLVDAEFVRVGSSLSALECIRFGTTTINDNYFYAHETAAVIEQAGLRGLIAYPYIDFATPEEKNLGDSNFDKRTERFLAFYEKYKDHPRIRPALGPHAPYTCSDDLLREVAELSKAHNIPIHMHVCETRREVDESVSKYGKGPAKRIADLGVLTQHLIAAHGVHLSDEEVNLFKNARASIVHCPDSNLKLSSGIAPIVKYREKGLSVGLGSDGAASNNDLSMFGAMDLSTKLQKVFNQSNTAMTALDAINLATIEGARALGLEKLVGSIEVGKRADFIALRTDYPHVKPIHSVLSQIVYAYQGLEVDTVVCDGRVLMQDQAFKTLNASSIYKDAERIREKIANHLKTLG